ncbi:MAG: amidohydrolase [bacterium]|nr:amidohydrolase [bacterium]
MKDFQLFVGRAVRLPNGIVGDAVLVRDGLVAAVGSESRIRADLPEGASCDVHSFAGRTVLPGLRDSHLHPVAYTALLTGASLHDVDSMTALQTRLADTAALGTGLVSGWNLNESTMAENRLPTASDLDVAVSDRPVMVHRYDGHLAIVNSTAMEIAGIGPDTVNPEGGLIDRDAAGRPNGVLRETAIDLAAGAPGIQNPVSPRDVANCMRRLATRGITSIGAMVRSGDGPWSHLGDEADIVVAAAPDVPIRIHAFITADSPSTLEVAATKLEAAGERVTWAGVKRFGDGSFGSHTAAMLEPFADDPDERGTLRLNESDAEMARLSIAAGRAVAIHAIGDAAAARVLDLFEDLAADGAAPHKLRMEHASLLSAADMERMGRLGAVASVQPAFLGSETDWIENRVGPDRLSRTYAFASLIAAGVLVVGGSDSPVEAPDPWEAMALARDRAGLVPAEALTASQALALYTTSAAKALGELPPLAVGSPADFVIVDRDPIESSPDEVRATQVIATFVGGQLVDVSNAGHWWI